MTDSNIRFRPSVDDPDVAYVELPGHPGTNAVGCVARTVGLDEYVEGYNGPQINLDFDARGELIGIEILA